MSGRGTTVDRAASYQAESKGEFSVDDCVSSRGFFKQSRERVGAVVIYRRTHYKYMYTQGHGRVKEGLIRSENRRGRLVETGICGEELFQSKLSSFSFFFFFLLLFRDRRDQG